MTRLKKLIKEVLSTPPKKKDCNCGCGGCSKKAISLNEGIESITLSEGLQYHINNKTPLTEQLYRAGSKKYFELWAEARSLYSRNLLNVKGDDEEILNETYLGYFGMYEGKKVPLGLPMENTVNESEDLDWEDDWEDDDNIYTGPYSYGIDRRTWDGDREGLYRLEAIRKMLKKYPKELAKLESDPYYPALDMTYDELVKWYKSISNFDLSEAAKKKKKKDPPIGKPKRGGSKAYYVYVRDPKTKKVKKVSFGSGGLRAKIKNKKARNAFAARHNCKNKKDRTKAGYWSCNLPRYASQLGLGANMNTFW